MRYTFCMQSPARSGFTTIELIIFSAIFAIVSVAFLSILVAVVRVQSRQGAANEVNQQSDFALATIQRIVEQSSQIEGTAGVAVTDVTMRMPEDADDPTRVYVQNGQIFVQVNGGASEPLTTEAVEVTSASFVKRANPGGKDSLSVVMTISNNSDNPTRYFARAINVLVSRVSAATFDSDVIPNTGDTFKLGVSSQKWDSVNEVIFFDGSNVGIGAQNPTSKLEVDGGVRLNAGGARPSCTSGIRGTVWVTQNGGGTPDTIDACLKTSTSTYSWVAI